MPGLPRDSHRRPWHARCYIEDEMLPLRPAAGALVGALLLAPSVARAQTIAAGNPYPDRLFGTTDQGATSPRGTPFDLYGVSYADCAGGMTLRFYLDVSGFTADQTLQIWAAPSPADCTQAAARTGTPTCWLLAAPIANVATGPATVDVSVWDLVGNQLSSLAATRTTTYTPLLDASACLAQSGPEAVPMYIFFMPIDSSNNVVGGATLYRYEITTDLVAPGAPASQPLTVGDTFLTVNWSASTDPDTLGYDVFTYPAAGAIGDAQASVDADGPLAECTETGTGDNECYTFNTGGNTYDGGTSACPALPAAFTAASIYPASPSTTSSAGSEASDEAGDASAADAASTSTSSGEPGIGPSQLQAYLVPSQTVPTVYGATNGSLQVSGLTDGTHYAFVVSAVDAEGNVGPPSATPQCDFPDTTTDFFQSYRRDGGDAGGCALDPQRLSGVGAGVAGLGLLLAAAARRRRRS
jgi:hypothetical protein